MRGVPYRTQNSEVLEFFRDFPIEERSVIFGNGPDGRKNGFGAVLMKDAESARKAAEELDRQNIGDRYVELSVISYGQYQRFN